MVMLTHDLMWTADVTPPVVKRSSMTNTVVVLTVERNQINSMMWWPSHAVAMAAVAAAAVRFVVSHSRHLLN